MMAVPGTPMVTEPVDELIDATEVLLDAQVHVPLLVEFGAATVKPAPR
jgi:Leu/Phe-tRNA-protein transferase